MFRIALGNEKYRFCLIKLWFSYIYAKSHQDLPWAPRAPRSQQNPPGASMSCYNWCSGGSQMNNS